MNIHRRSVLLSVPAAAVAVNAQAFPSGGYQTDALSGCVLIGTDDRSLVLSSFHKQWLLVDLWASWCSACLSGMGGLRRLAAERADIMDTVLISHPESWEKDKAWHRRQPGPYTPLTIAPQSYDMVPAVFAYSPVNKAYAIPRTFLMDSSRRQVFSHEGSMEWETSDIVRHLHR